ncbi:MAG: AmiS/UreI family transporter, partial [Halomonadaceae bacterium]
SYPGPAQGANSTPNDEEPYFCLFVALTALPTGVLQWARADTLWGWWSTVNWLAWAVLWLGFYLMLCHWPRMQPLMARLSLVLGVFTGWVPGYLLLNGLLPLGT